MTDATVGAGALPAHSGTAHVVTATYDFAVNNALQNAVIQLIAVPANTYVHSVVYECTTAEGGTLTFNIGDDVSGGGDVDGWDAGVEGNSAAGKILGDGAHSAAGKLYIAADTIDVIALNAADAAAIKVQAVMVPL